MVRIVRTPALARTHFEPAELSDISAGVRQGGWVNPDCKPIKRRKLRSSEQEELDLSEYDDVMAEWD